MFWQYVLKHIVDKRKFPAFRFAAYCKMKRGLSQCKTWPFERQYTAF